MPQAQLLADKKTLVPDAESRKRQPHLNKSLVQESVKFERRTRANGGDDDDGADAEWITGETEEEMDEQHQRWAHKVGSESHQSLESGFSMVSGKRLFLSQQPFPATGSYMGRCWRNPITAKLVLKKVNPANDFRVIDLFTRTRIVGTPEELYRDPYLYKPVIMSLRTWMYHDFFRQKKLVATADENGMVKFVLNLSCIDANINSGQQSSVLYYMPMVMLTAFTKDSAAVASSLIALVALGIIAFICNSTQLYSRARFYGMPLRAAHLGVLIWVLISGQWDSLELFGFAATFIFILLDVVQGDIHLFSTYRFWCRYSIVRELPMRCFICRRHGAAHLEELTGHKQKIPSTVHGISTWLKEYSYIVELCGTLCQLERISLKEWRQLQRDNEDKKVYFLSMGLFDKKTPAMWNFCEDFEEPPPMIGDQINRAKAEKFGADRGSKDSLRGSKEKMNVENY
mmetsp:Transcript_26979/g.62761  ORF Transcript_26979/g.62761 Transcript_26979/m.62761 type:complete len:457 (-) Transcript_26979:59-1429(-)